MNPNDTTSSDTTIGRADSRRILQRTVAIIKNKKKQIFQCGSYWTGFNSQRCEPRALNFLSFFLFFKKCLSYLHSQLTNNQKAPTYLQRAFGDLRTYLAIRAAARTIPYEGACGDVSPPPPPTLSSDSPASLVDILLSTGPVALRSSAAEGGRRHPKNASRASISFDLSTGAPRSAQVRLKGQASPAKRCDKSRVGVSTGYTSFSQGHLRPLSSSL